MSSSVRAQAPPWFPGQWRSGGLEGNFCTLSTSHILSHRWGEWEELAGDNAELFFSGWTTVALLISSDFLHFLWIKRSESRCLEALCIMPSGDPFAHCHIFFSQGTLIKLESKRKRSWQRTILPWSRPLELRYHHVKHVSGIQQLVQSQMTESCFLRKHLPSRKGCRGWRELDSSSGTCWRSVLRFPFLPARKKSMKTSAQDVVASGNFELLKTLAHSTLQVGIVEDILMTILRTLFLRLACLVLCDSARWCEEQLALQAVAR